MYEVETNFFSSMESFDRYGSRNAQSLHHAQRLETMAAQRKLPSFREIIPQHLHNEIESVPQSTTLDLQSPETSISSQQGAISTTRSIAPSPVHSQPGTLQTMNDTFDPTYLSQQQQQQQRRYSDQNTAWVSASTYGGMNINMIQHQSAYQQQMSSNSRGNPDLPSIRDIHSRTERLQGGGSDAYGAGDYQYQSVYNSSHIPRTELESNNGYTQRRQANVEQMQRNRHTYQALNGNYGQEVSEYSRYGDGGYHPLKAQLSYPNHFAELDYSLHSMQGATHSGFGLMVDNDGGKLGRRRRGNLPKHVTDLLKQWLHEHLDHPYPTEEDKQWFIAQTGLSISQISNWFINARRRQVPSIKQSRERSQHRGGGEVRVGDMIQSQDPSRSPTTEC